MKIGYLVAALILAASCREVRAPTTPHHRCKVVGVGTSDKKLNALVQEYGAPLLIIDETVLVCPCSRAAGAGDKGDKEKTATPPSSGGCGCASQSVNRSSPTTTTAEPGGYGGSTESGKYGGATESGKYGGSTESGKYGGSTESGKYGGATDAPKLDDVACYARKDCSGYAVTGNRPIAFFDGELWEPSGRCVGR